MPRTEAGKRLLAKINAEPPIGALLPEDIDAIEAEAVILDRDALARALHAEDCWLAGIPECGEPTGPLFYRQADRIIAALREQADATD